MLKLMIVLFGITLLAPPIQCWLNRYKMSVILLRFLTPILVVFWIAFVLWCWMCFAMKMELLIPTAFSPNEDGVNDTYFIVDKDGVVTDFKLEIFNRLGQKVFASNR